MTIEVRRATIAPHTHRKISSSPASHQDQNSHVGRRVPFPIVYPAKEDFSPIRYGVTANIAAFHVILRARQLGVRFPVSEFFFSRVFLAARRLRKDKQQRVICYPGLQVFCCRNVQENPPSRLRFKPRRFPRSSSLPPCTVGFE